MFIENKCNLIRNDHDDATGNSIQLIYCSLRNNWIEVNSRIKFNELFVCLKINITFLKTVNKPCMI